MTPAGLVAALAFVVGGSKRGRTSVNTCTRQATRFNRVTTFSTVKSKVMTLNEIKQSLRGMYDELDFEEQNLLDAAAAKAGKTTTQHMLDCIVERANKVAADTRPIPSMDEILRRTNRS